MVFPYPYDERLLLVPCVLSVHRAGGNKIYESNGWTDGNIGEIVGGETWTPKLCFTTWIVSHKR